MRQAREVEGLQNQLVYSKLFHSYLEIAQLFGLERVVPEKGGGGWSWLTDYVKAVTSLEAIATRNAANDKYLVSVVGEIDAQSGADGTDQRTNWASECDVELIQWSSEVPTDFQLGGRIGTR